MFRRAIYPFVRDFLSKDITLRKLEKIIEKQKHIPILNTFQNGNFNFGLDQKTFSLKEITGQKYKPNHTDWLVFETSHVIDEIIKKEGFEYFRSSFYSGRENWLVYLCKIHKKPYSF